VLEVGDVIPGVFGKPFTEDARKSFGRAIVRGIQNPVRLTPREGSSPSFGAACVLGLMVMSRHAGIAMPSTWGEAGGGSHETNDAS